MKNILSGRKNREERSAAVENPVFNSRMWKTLWKTRRGRGMREGRTLKYSHLVYCCPYYEWDAKTTMHCEGGRLSFPDRDTAQAYFTTYCGDIDGWRRCTVARAITRFYEREEA